MQVNWNVDANEHVHLNSYTDNTIDLLSFSFMYPFNLYFDVIIDALSKPGYCCSVR